MKNMTRTAALLAALCVIAVSGCNGGAQQSTTAPAQTAADNGKETQIAYEAPKEDDTTDKAVEYIGRTAPHLAEFYRLRHSIPQEYHAADKNTGNEYRLVIVSADKMAEYIKSGAEVITDIYDGDKAYEVSETEKVIYDTGFYGELIKEMIQSKRLKVPQEGASGYEYKEDTAQYEGNEYIRAQIIASDGSIKSEYYFDKSTGGIKYIVSGENVTEVNRLSSEILPESMKLFDFPEGYKRTTFDEYFSTMTTTAAPEAAPEAAQSSSSQAAQ